MTDEKQPQKIYSPAFVYYSIERRIFMKLKKHIFLLIAILSVSMTVACSPVKIEQKIDSIEDSVERKFDKAEDKIKDSLKPNNNSLSDKSEITSSLAEETALNHAGFTKEEVSGLHTEYELDDGIPRYDVKFYVERIEYDYEIHAQTGEILSFEMDN